MFIPEEYIEYSRMPSGDSLRKVFFYEGELYRGIGEESIESIRKMFDIGLIDSLNEKGLIPYTEITNYQTSYFPLVLKHERIHNISYIFEWTFHMILDAAAMIIDLCEVLDEFNYKLVDCHPYNVLFRNGKPCYVDFGGICENQGNNMFSSVYSDYHLYYDFIPSMLIKSPHLSKVIIRMTYDYFKYRDFFDLAYGIYGSRVRYYLLRLLFMADSRWMTFVQSRTHSLNNYRKRIKKKNKKVVPRQDWSDYQVLREDYLINPQGISKIVDFSRYERALAVLEDLKVKTVFEWGSCRGLFAIAACGTIKSISSYVCSDYEDRSIDDLYLFINKYSEKYLFLKKITPVVEDFKDAIHYSETNPAKRFKSECVLAMAITHHILLAQEVSVDVMFETFRSFTSKYIIVEFMPLGLWGGGEEYPKLPKWYSLEWFLDHMKKQFEILSHEQLETNRIMVIGKVHE